MSPCVVLGVRAAGLLVFVGVLIWPVEFRPAAQAEDSQGWVLAANDAAPLASLLLREYPELSDPAARSEVTAALRAYSAGSRTLRSTIVNRTAMTTADLKQALEKADRLFRAAGPQLAASLGRVAGAMDLSGALPVSATRAVSIPYQSTAVLLRRAASGIPRFIIRKVDLSAPDPIRVDLGSAADFIALLQLTAPARSTRRQIELTAGPAPVATLDLRVTIPPKFALRVSVLDGDGRPTEAALGVYSQEKKLLVPANALDFSAGGYNYQAVSHRSSANTRYWPGGEGYTRCFFLKGAFTLDLPAGTYRLLAAKGPEFVPVDRSVVLADAANTQSIELRRWTDMSSRGWHSGDAHIHYARPDEAANRQLQLWLRAEDLHVGNILRMGDGQETYFDQYAFGEAGRYVESNLVLVPGQEDPRTAVLGHTISLNILRPVRNLERGYYLYGAVFDDVHQQGGLTGFAHVNDANFNVARDMTIDVARNRADFSEICEFGQVGTATWYEFLNLGFRLTAAGGSDVPWGGTAGESRMYVFTGNAALNPDQWYRGFRLGHTFVTTGPMLEFTVSDRLPGDSITAVKGDRLKVYARATTGSPTFRLDRLEIVANGEVIRSAESNGAAASLDFELPAHRSMWVAARVAGAHTTPVYVTVDGRRHWKTAAVPQLIAKRLDTLNAIDRLMDRNGSNIDPARAPEWENPESFRRGIAQLRKAIQEARDVYLQLRREHELNP